MVRGEVVLHFYIIVLGHWFSSLLEGDRLLHAVFRSLLRGRGSELATPHRLEDESSWPFDLIRSLTWTAVL